MELLTVAIVVVVIVGLAILLINESPVMQKPLKLVVIAAALIFMLHYAYTHGVFR